MNYGIHFLKFQEFQKKIFFKYYANSNEGFAIKIDNLHIFEEYIDMNQYDDFRAPQSFCYVENNKCLRELLLV